MSDSVQVHVNGEARQIAAGQTIAGLLLELGLGGKPVAVERNQHVVPRADHATTVIEPGDRLEVVTFVGGG